MSSSVRASQRIDPFAGHELGWSTASPFGSEPFVETGRQQSIRSMLRGKLAVLLPRDAGRDEDTEVADVLVDG